MASIIDYVNSFSKTFTEEPVNRVDSLVFSWLSYLKVAERVPEACTTEGLALADVAAKDMTVLTAQMHSPQLSEELIRACAASPRFGNVVACRAVDDWSADRETQFSALTFILPDGQGAFIAFRGTDDTLVGWKENFNMAVSTEVPAQASARAYLESVAKDLACNLWMGGHSKGGNLAVFAYMTADPLARLWVKRCFNHDGPGFTPATVSTALWEGDESLVDRMVMEESIVGLLLGNPVGATIIVRSTNPGILQHDPFSWVVEGTDFAQASAQSYDVYLANKRLTSWLSTLSTADRERFIGVLYDLVQTSGEITFSGMLESMANDKLESTLKRLDGMPEGDRDFFLRQLEELAATLVLGPAPVEAKTPEQKANAAAETVEDTTARFNDRLAKLESYLR